MSEAIAEWTANVLKGNGGVRDDGHWHSEHCPGAPAFPCHCALIENEMADYRMIMRHCAEIYDEASYGRVSKPNTLPSVVVDFMHEGQQQDIDEAVKEAIAELPCYYPRTTTMTCVEWNAAHFDEPIGLCRTCTARNTLTDVAVVVESGEWRD